KDCLDLIERTGAEASSVRLSGGGARSLFWRQMLADIFLKPATTLETQEGSAYGAALLAAVGTGEFSSVPEACGAAIREQAALLPRASESAIYASGHARYQSLYPALRSFFAEV